MKYGLALILSILTFVSKAQNFDNLVQVDGVVMTSDSLRYISYATVMVKNQNRGVECSNSGVFSIVCYKGDTLVFTNLGFRRKEVVIPKQVEGIYYNVVALMVQDTFYLPETIVRPLPTREEFDYAFQYWRIPNDQYEIARMNTNRFALRAIAFSLPRDGGENQALYQAQAANMAVYTGMPNGQPMNVLNPFAWSDFFQAWKRGDFRNLNNNYGSYNPANNH
jgi:hypothetical protein